MAKDFDISFGELPVLMSRGTFANVSLGIQVQSKLSIK